MIDFVQAVIGPKRCPWCRDRNIETLYDKLLKSKFVELLFRIPGISNSFCWYWNVSRWPGLPWHQRFHGRRSGAAHDADAHYP